MDYNPPNPPGAGETPLDIYNKNEKAFQSYESNRLNVCSTLYSSLSPEVRNRADNDVAATRLKERGMVGALWGFIRQVVQGIGAETP